MSANTPNDGDWHDLLHEFRRLGGIAENLRLGSGSLGRGLFPENPALPVALRAPENLLLPLKYATFHNGQFRVSPDAPFGRAEAAWLEHYENAFSWGAGGRSDTECFLEGMSTVPQHIREKLARSFGMDFCLRDVSPDLVQLRFLFSRMISYKDEQVVMPLVELANHGGGSTYSATDGVGISGTFGEEVLVRYSDSDSLTFFSNWGFVCERPMAMSLPVHIPSEFGQLNVLRDTNEGEIIEIAGKKPVNISLPKLSLGDRSASLSFLMLGFKGFPRVPRGAFQRVFRQAGRQVRDELFEHVQFINRTLFLELMGLLEGVEGLMAGNLRRMCRLQLETLSHCIGTREI